MDREAQPEPPAPEPAASEHTAGAPPAPPTGPAGEEASRAKPRTPLAVVVAIALLWLLAVATAWTALVSAVATSFEVTSRFSGAWTPLEFIEPLLIAATAAVLGTLAVKLRSGRDWARTVVLILSTLALAAALVSRAAFTAAAGMIGMIVFALLVVLPMLRPTRHWCDCDAPRHSPKADTAARPPYQVVAELLVLWAAVGLALFLGARRLLDLAGEDADLAAATAAWGAGAAMALAIIHGALNIALTYQRNWARLTTLALAAAYTLLLVIIAVTGTWTAALLALAPAALAASLLSAQSKAWCRTRNGSSWSR